MNTNLILAAIFVLIAAIEALHHIYLAYKHLDKHPAAATVHLLAGLLLIFFGIAVCFRWDALAMPDNIRIVCHSAGQFPILF